MDRNDPIVAAALLGFDDSFRQMADRPTATILDDAEVICVSLAPQYAMLNLAVIRERPGDPAAVVARVLDFYDGLERPFCINVPDDILEVHDACYEAGLIVSGHAPFMVLRSIDPQAFPAAPESARLERVQDTRALAGHLGGLAAGFAMPREIAELMWNEQAIGLQNMALFNLVVEDEVVAVASSISVPPAVGVYGVATLEAMRGRGYGAAATAAVVRAGLENGCDIAFLQATPSGKPVYERMGFKTAGEHSWFMRPAAEPSADQT